MTFRIGSIGLLNKRPFLEKVLLLFSTTGVGQVVVMAFYPIVTRLYSPEDIGVYSVFAASFSLMLSIGSSQYENAIPIPRDEESAINLLALSILCIVGMSFIALTFVFFFHKYVEIIFNLDMNKSYLLLAILGVVGAGIYNIFSCWAIRVQGFKELAGTKVLQGIGQVSIQISWGAFYPNPLGLIVGFLVGRILGCGRLFFAFKRGLKRNVAEIVSTSSIIRVAKQYRKFPLLSTPTLFLNTIVLQGPLLLINNFYGLEVTGWFNLAWIVVGTPVSMIGQAIGQVYYSQLAVELRTGSGHAIALFEDIVRKTTAVGIPVFALVYFFAPKCITLIFGPHWGQSGVYIQYLALAFFINFISNPIGSTFDITQRLDLALTRESLRMILNSGSIVWAAMNNYTADVAIMMFGCAFALGGIIYILLAWYAIRNFEQIT